MAPSRRGDGAGPTVFRNDVNGTVVDADLLRGQVQALPFAFVA